MERLTQSIDAPFDQNAYENYPYALAVPGEAPGQESVVVGVKHTNNPNDPRYPRQFDLEKGLWGHFKGEHALNRDDASDNCIVIVEGGLRKLEEGAYIRDGEACMLTLLANEAGVPIISGEPDIVEGAKILLGQIVPENVTSLPYYEVFDPDILSYWHYMKQAMQVISAVSAGVTIADYDSYVRNRPSMVQLIEAAPSLGLNFSSEYLEPTHAQYCPDLPFDPLVRKPDGSLHDPEEYRKRLFIADGNITPDRYGDYNALERLGTNYAKDYRDIELARKFVENLRQGKNIFSFEGGGHWLRVGRQLPDILQIPREALRLYVGAAACHEFLVSTA